MALTPPTNLPTSAGTGPTQQQAKDQLDILKQILKVQGDHKNVLKESVKDLNDTLKNYDKMEAKLASINKSTINIKEIESQIKSAKEKSFANTKKLADLQENLSTKQQVDANNYLKALDVKSNLEKALLNAQKNGDISRQKQLSIAIGRSEILISKKEDILNLDQLAYAEALKADELNKEILGKQEEQLATEEKIRKNIGLTGAAFGIFAKKLGVGNEYYESMVEKSRKLNEEGKKLTFFDKVKGIGSAAGGAIKETVKDPFALVAAMGTAIPIVGAAIGGLVSGLKSVFDYIVGIQDQTVKFARAMNLSTEDARQLKMQFADINVANGDLFVNTQKLVEAQTEMVGLLGVTNVMSAENLATNIKLKDIAGIEAETIGSITEASIINGKSNESIVKSVFAQVQGLKQATGIQFENKKILKEASSLGGVLGLQFAKYPAQLTKSLLTVKAMGLELKQVDALADSFLDFESSVSKEFEAQLLTGKQINLEKARELFLNNDLAGAAAEINKQVGSSAEFMAMNRIQQEAFAGAMGMSRDQMGDMLKQQEMLSKLGAKDTDNAREQLKLGLAKYENQKALSAAIGEENYQNLVNASLQEKIGAFMEKIKQSISDFVEKSGIIEKIQGFMEYLSSPENIRNIISGVRDFFAGAVEFIGKAAYYILEGLDYVAFGQIPNEFIDSIKSGAENMGAQIRSMGGDLSVAAANNAVGGTKVKTETASTAPQPYQKRMGEGTTTFTAQSSVNGEQVNTMIIATQNRKPEDSLSIGQGSSMLGKFS